MISLSSPWTLVTYPIRTGLSSIVQQVQLDSCAQRIFIPTGNSHSCPAQIAYRVEVKEADAFLPSCVQMYGQHGIQNPFGTTYDFVLSPNSTAYLTMSYDFGSNDVPPASFFTNTTYDIYKLDNGG